MNIFAYWRRPNSTLFRCFECAESIKVDDSDKYKDLRQCLNVIKKAKGLEVDDEAEDDTKEIKSKVYFNAWNYADYV